MLFGGNGISPLIKEDPVMVSCIRVFLYKGKSDFLSFNLINVCLSIFYAITTDLIVPFLQGACVSKLAVKGKLEDNKATKQIVSLLSAPLEKYNDIDTALKLSNYPRVLEFIDQATNKVMANVIIQSIMKNKTCISTADKVSLTFHMLPSLKFSCH